MISLPKPALLACLAVGWASACTVDKSPPQVEWLSPTTSVSVSGGDAIALRLRVEDPAPVRGQTEGASWRITIGPEIGATWWTENGQWTTAPSGGPMVDTITTTWQVAPLPPGTSGPVSLVISGIVTDGEGQSGGDFTSASQEGIALASSGLWWAGGQDAPGWHVFDGSMSGSQASPSGPSSPVHCVHLDGEEMLVSGGQDLQGWLLVDGNPAPQPAWTAALPSSTQAGGTLHLRRASSEHTTFSLAQVGWPGGTAWMDADGDLVRSWLLEPDEWLLDGTVVGEDMVHLAKTSSGEFRLVRYDINTSARLESITWTPTAPGSQGSDATGWLLALEGWPTAVEADGTARQWNLEGSATPISTTSLPGSGPVSAAGLLPNGRQWASRNTVVFMDEGGTTLANHGAEIREATLDRAANVLWILAESGEEQAWKSLNANTLQGTGLTIPAGAGIIGGTVAHNRPGPL